MFGRKKARTRWRMRAVDPAGNALFDLPTEEFDLPEALTVSLSVEFFNDPNPCEIHRAAVRWRAAHELQEGVKPGVDVDVAGLPPSLRRLLPESAVTLRVWEEAL